MSLTIAASTALMAPARRNAPTLSATVLDVWRTLAKALRDPYRPERHYMRGPGPKWREKHQSTRAFA